MCAIDHDSEPGQRCPPVGREAVGQRGEQVILVTLALNRGVGDPAEATGGRLALARPPVGGEPVRDLVLSGVRQLEAAADEQLDPVIPGRIMAGGKHDTEFRAKLAGQIRDRGSGEDTQPQHVHPGPGQACDHRCFEELPRGPRIAPDQRYRPLASLLGRGERTCVAEDRSGRRGQIHGQPAGQVLTGHTTDTISSEKPTHETCPP